jgi:hypothetical protein
VVFVPVAVMVPLLIWRLLDEERMLAGTLPGTSSTGIGATPARAIRAVSDPDAGGPRAATLRDRRGDEVAG